VPGVNFPKAYADRAAKLRVPGGFVLVAAFAWFSHPSVESLSYGIPVSVLGLLLRGWAAGHLAKNQKLTMSGPYRFLRNPLYIGTLLVAAGLTAASRSPMLGLVFAAVFFLIYLPVIELEEQHLRRLFPEFADYARRVPALVPRLPPTADGTGFRSSLYFKNREYEALLGFLAGAAWLIVKMRMGI
jgi:protein-S-isoprenylcysteine O-methyltransferase Ste14